MKVNILNRFLKTEATMLQFAEKAKSSVNGKHNGYTAERATALADHSGKIGRGLLPVGTMINWKEYNF